MRTRWTVFFIGVLLAASPASAASNSTDVVRELASRVGPIVGAALACRDIARSGLPSIVDRFHNVIRDASDREADRTDLAQAFDRSITRAAAKFIEKTHDLFPGLLYGDVSAVGATSLAGELMLLGPRFTNGVIVIAPAVAGHSSLGLKYKYALAKYSPGEQPDYTSLEGYVSASVLLEALKRTGRQIDTERLVENPEAMNNFDLGLGATLSFSSSEHQASHKIWETALDETGTFQPIELE